MPPLILSSNSTRFSIDPTTGRWLEFTGGQTGRSWLSHNPDHTAGLPFVQGTAIERGKALTLSYEQTGSNQLAGISARGETRSAITLEDDQLVFSCELPDRRGPRSGLFLDLDHLDLPGGTLHEQLMPVSMATSESLDWAYVIWQRGPEDLLITAIDGPFCAWRINYSVAGHRMTGFEVLARADDVICPLDRFPGGRLPAVTKLTCRIATASSRLQALGKAGDLLGMGMVNPSETGGVVGTRIAISTHGSIESATIQKPHEPEEPIDPAQGSILLDRAGEFIIRARSGDRVHETRLLGMEDWKSFAERSVEFHRQHFQLECGAFARALRSHTLKPDGRTPGNNHFGNAEESGSCKTGEFGGFAAWALILHQKTFGLNSSMLESVERYFDWILNRGREENPRPDTVCWHPHISQGLPYSSGHMYKSLCYAQYETWLIRQLVDTIELGSEYPGHTLSPALIKLCQHFMDDHTDDSGVVWNQNFPEESPVDYSTVDCPLVHLIKAGQLLRDLGEPLGPRMLAFCRKQADHLWERGFNFPTEGEPCTEDGSIACQAWGLAYAFNHLDNPNPEWIQLANDLMAFHSKLEMFGTDVRSNGSSLRFWESMYESDNYGPSINAGHGWSLWSASARWELHLATGSYAHLRQSWRHTLPVISKFDDRGAGYPCYTPDIIPSIPHDDSWGDPAKRLEGRMSSSVCGWGYPDTVAASSMYLFIVAPWSWYYACGFDPSTGQAINAVFDKGVLTPATASSCTRVALAGNPDTTLKITNLAQDGRVTLVCEQPLDNQDWTGMEDLQIVSSKEWQFSCPDGFIKYVPNC